MGGVARTGREDKVRTYNYSQNRVTDHRCGSESNDLDGILGGGPSLEALMDDVREWMIEGEMMALAAAEQALERFAERWDPKYPAISPSWLADWDRLTVFFDYPPAIRRAVYTTNAIESLNYSLRKVLKGRSAFPNDESIMKVLYMGLQHVAKKWTQPIPEWKAALNQFVILFGERVQV